MAHIIMRITKMIPPLVAMMFVLILTSSCINNNDNRKTSPSDLATSVVRNITPTASSSGNVRISNIIFNGLKILKQNSYTLST